MNKKRVTPDDVKFNITNSELPGKPACIEARVTVTQALSVSYEEWKHLRFSIEEEARSRLRLVLMDQIYGDVRELARQALRAYMQQSPGGFGANVGIPINEQTVVKLLRQLIDVGGRENKEELTMKCPSCGSDDLRCGRCGYFPIPYFPARPGSSGSTDSRTG